MLRQETNQLVRGQGRGGGGGVWICISLMIDDVKHSFLYLLAIQISSSEKKCLFNCSDHFLKLDCFCFVFAVKFMSSLHFFRY